LAETFAISDSYFCDLIGPTSPNRFYSLAATSFGHVVTPANTSGGDTPPAQGFQPINGTIFDKLDAQGIKWSEYYDPHGDPEVEDEVMPGRPYGHVFRPTSPNYLLMSQFYTDAAAGNLAQVVWIDLQHDEHPPADIRAGQQEVADVITAIRNSPAWSTSIVLFSYDEHGGAYDHVRPPAVVPPDKIPPGLCADNSNPPGSLQPGGGVACSESFTDARSICPSMTSSTFPADCAAFKQLGIRVPLVAISPFARPAYVSHVVTDHTSVLALIEKRFIPGVHLTRRDAAASTLEDLFDFVNAPSATASVPASLAEPPAPDHNCP
jgi:phospholipase C